MKILSVDDAAWGVAKKTKPLRAKPMVTLLVDRSVMTKFLVDTLEAREPVSPDAMFCIGESNDAWQQTAAKLLAKYNVTSIDADGWMVCEPKPENSVSFFEVTRDVLEKLGYWESYVSEGQGYIVGMWGQEIAGMANIQKFVIGDYIARNRVDLQDVWVVRRKIWQNSYVQIGG